MKVCEQCKGVGVIDIENGKSFKDCPGCHGAQYLYDGTEEELEALRQEIYLVYPEVKHGMVRMKSMINITPASYEVGGFIQRTDRSLEAYKAWVLGTLRAITGSEDDGSVSEKEWESGWKKFLEKERK